MLKKILIDTNAYSRFLAGDKNVLEALIEAQLAYMSVFVMGELFAGFKGGNRERENKKMNRASSPGRTITLNPRQFAVARAILQQIPHRQQGAPQQDAAV